MSGKSLYKAFLQDHDNMMNSKKIKDTDCPKCGTEVMTEEESYILKLFELRKMLQEKMNYADLSIAVTNDEKTDVFKLQAGIYSGFHIVDQRKRTAEECYNSALKQLVLDGYINFGEK